MLWARNRFADVSIIFGFTSKPDECQGFHYLECPCLYSLTQSKYLSKTLKTIRNWKLMVRKVAEMEEFHNRNVWKQLIRNSYRTKCSNLLFDRILKSIWWHSRTTSNYQSQMELQITLFYRKTAFIYHRKATVRTINNSFVSAHKFLSFYRFFFLIILSFTAVFGFI